MRKIRAWCSARKSYITNFSVEPSGRLVEIYTNHHKQRELIREDSTGLNFQCGSEAFEGDILFDAHTEEFFAIEFSEGRFHCGDCGLLEDVLISDDVSKMGNIHENPDLL